MCFCKLDVHVPLCAQPKEAYILSKEPYIVPKELQVQYERAL